MDIESLRSVYEGLKGSIPLFFLKETFNIDVDEIIDTAEKFAEYANKYSPYRKLL